MAILSAPMAQADDDTCSVVSSLAETIMRTHQEGVPLRDALSVADGMQDGPIRDINRRLVLMAYERRRYQTPRVKQIMVDEFRDEVHIACLRQQG